MMMKPLSRLYVVVCDAQAKQKNTFSRYYNSNNVVEPWTQLLLLMLPMAARESRGVMEGAQHLVIIKSRFGFWCDCRTHMRTHTVRTCAFTTHMRTLLSKILECERR